MPDACWDMLWEIGEALEGISAQLEGVAKEMIDPSDQKHRGEMMFCSGKLQGFSMCLRAAAGEQAARRHGA